MITYYGKWPDVVQAAGEVGMEITDELELTRHYVRIVVYVEEEPRRTEIVSPSGQGLRTPKRFDFPAFYNGALHEGAGKYAGAAEKIVPGLR